MICLEDKCKVVEAYFIHSSFSVKEANKYEAHFKEINKFLSTHAFKAQEATLNSYLTFWHLHIL